MKAIGRFSNSIGMMLAAVAPGAILAPQLVYAQTATQTAQQINNDESGIADIIVTANRREEAIQSVPVSVTALSGDSLREQGVSTASDLLGRIPSLSVQPNGTQRDAEGITIRGQGQTYGATVGVANYFAEVPLIQSSIIANQGGPGNFFDLQSLQVLRGPQGTLFGKNTTGGALLLAPARPTNRFEGYVQGQVGNYNDREFSGVLNLPIIDDTLMIRVAGQKVDRDGYTKDVGTGDATLSLPFQGPGFTPLIIPNSGLVLPGNGPNTGIARLPGLGNSSADFLGKDYDDRHYWTARLGILFRPAPGIENYLVGFYTKSHNNGTGQKLTSATTEHPSLINLVANAYGGRGTFDAVNPALAQAILARYQALRPRETALNTDQFYRLKTWGLVDTFSADLSDTLTFRNIISYQRLEQEYAWDLDGSYLPILSQVPGIITAGATASVPAIATLGKVGDVGKISDTSLFTAEPQLQGQFFDKKLVGVLGAFYSKQKPEGLQATGSYNAATYGGSFFSVTTHSKAVYGQGTLDLGLFAPALDSLKLTAGIRHTQDQLAGRSYSPAFVLLPVSAANQKSEATTWTVGLDYQLAQRVLVFGKVTRGYKAGGFALSAVNPANITFGPERVVSYEIGVKSDFRVADMPVRLNVSAYNLDYDGIQRTNADNFPNGCGTPTAPTRCAITGNTTGFDQGSITFNTGKSRVRGIELEAAIRPVEGLDISGSYSYTHAKYLDYHIAVPPDPASGAQVQSRMTCDGSVPIPVGASAPKTKINLTCAPFLFTPTNQFSVNARYSFETSNNIGTIVLAANYTHSDKSWTSAVTLPAAMPNGYIDGYNIMNASVEWNSIMGSSLDARLFVTNLTNTTYRVSNSNGDVQALGYSATIYNEPRMYGLSLRYRFGTGS